MILESFAGPRSRNRVVHVFDREGFAFSSLRLQGTENIRNLPGSPSCFNFYPAVGKFVHSDFLAWMHTQMLKHISAERDLAFGGDGKCVHGKPRCDFLNVTQKISTFKINQEGLTRDLGLTLAAG
jgi:hypothetical protein